MSNAKEDSFAASFNEGLAWRALLSCVNGSSCARPGLNLLHLSLRSCVLRKILFVELQKDAIKPTERIKIERDISEVLLKSLRDSFANHTARLRESSLTSLVIKEETVLLFWIVGESVPITHC